MCEQDLKGIVCQHKLAPYPAEQVPWIKVLSQAYSHEKPPGVSPRNAGGAVAGR